MTLPSGVDPEEIREDLLNVLGERRLKEEAEMLEGSLVEFVKAAWPAIKRHENYCHNWHVDAMCEHLTAITDEEIDRLQIWVPPGTMKSMTVSVFWHPWEWIRKPWLRYWGASYETRLASRLSAMSRDLIQHPWYQARFGDRFKIIRDAEGYWGNDQGGTRLATSPESTGSGEHGHRILIDDPINAREADAISKAMLEFVNEVWYDGTVATRGIATGHARVIIMQRLHERDLASHVLDLEDWVVLCLPEHYEDNHPYAWRGRAGRRDKSDLGSIIGVGDPRQEGDLLWPTFRSEEASQILAQRLKSHRAISQLQQRPAAREGQILKRHWWRFYDPKLFDDNLPKVELEGARKRRPRFTAVVQTVDTPLKDKESNDFVAIQAWGVIGSSRYLLDLRKDHMNYSQARRAIIDQSRYVRGLYPRIAHYILIENAGYGVELIVDLKRELTGVTKIIGGRDGDKVMRAEAASSDLESGNCFLPGRRLGEDEFSQPDEDFNAARINDFINSCAIFPNGAHDDDVDAWSQAMNWLRSRTMKRGRTASPFAHRRRRATVA